MKYNLSLIALSIALSLTACKKEIKVIKNPPAGNSSSESSLFALFTDQDEALFSENGPFRKRDEGRYLNSLSLEGLEQEIVFENGSKPEGFEIGYIISTKSGLLINLGFEIEDGPRQYNLYRLENGKTLKLIANDLRINQNYREYQKRYSIPTEDKSYFCSNQGVNMWDSVSKTLSLVRPFEENETCQGKQLGNQFYYLMQAEELDEEEVPYFSYSVNRIRTINSLLTFETLLSRDIDYMDGESFNAEGFSEFQNEVIFVTNYSQGYGNGLNESQVVKVSKNSLDMNFIYGIGRLLRTETSILHDGSLFEGKLLFKLSLREEIEPVDIYTEDGLSYVYSVSEVDSLFIFSYDGESVNLMKEIEGSPLTYYDLIKSEDTLFFLKNEYPFTQNEYIESYQQAFLLSFDLDLVHDFELAFRSRLYPQFIQNRHVLSVSNLVDPEEDIYASTIYLLPNSEDNLSEDSRFINAPYRDVEFLNFYNKVIFQASPNFNSEDQNFLSGFFGEDAVVRVIEKFRVIFNLGDT